MPARTAPSTWEPLGRYSPEQPVAWRAGRLVTARELLQEAAGIADRLPAATQGEELVVLCGDRLRLVASMLAAWRRGYAVALPPNAQPGAVAGVLGQRAVRRVLHDGDWSFGLDVRTVASSAAAVGAPAAWLRLATERTLATFHSSGSTGSSRASTKTAGQLLGEAAVLGETLGLHASDRVLTTVPAQHIYGLLMGVLVPLGRGASLVCDSPFQPESIAACARESGATVLVSVPGHLRALGTLRDGDLAGVRLVVSSSAPLEPATAAQLHRLGARVMELFGSTETGGIAFREPPAQLWQPLAGVVVSADPNGRLIVESPFLDRAAPRPFVTADCIDLSSDGTFVHAGRDDGVLKIAGKRIALGDLEQRLRGLMGVEDAAVIQVPVGGARGHEIWAMVVAPVLSVAAIRQNLLAWFDPVTLPRRFRCVDRIPRESNGKLPLQRWHEIFDGAAAEDFEVVCRRSRATEAVVVSGAAVEGTMWHEVELVVPKGLRYFQGHFDGYPILSGVVILNQIVLPEGRRVWPELRHLRGVSRLKFRRPIRPGAVLCLRLQRHPSELAYEFDVRSEGESYNSGTLTFGARS